MLVTENIVYWDQQLSKQKEDCLNGANSYGAAHTSEILRT